MTNEPRRTDSPEPGGDDSRQDEPVTIGTLFLMILFLAALGGMWLIMYLQLLNR